MRMLTNTLLVALVAVLTASTAVAQPGDRGPGDRGPGDRGDRRPDGGPGDRGPGRFPFPPNPLLAALDADKNGEISAEEIKNASEALKKLDKNDDGKLTRDELRPNFGPRPDSPRGPRPDGPPRRDGDRPAGRRDFVQGFLERFDANDDGKISKEEAPERMKERFDDIDANDDGALDKEELTKLFERFRDRRPEGERDRPERGSDQPDEA